MARARFVGVIHPKSMEVATIYCDSAEDFISNLGEMDKEKISALKVQAGLYGGNQKIERSVIFSNWRKLAESDIFRNFSKISVIDLYCEKNHDRKTAVDFLKEVNKSIKRGIRFKGLRTMYTKGAMMTSDEVEALVEGIEDEHREVLPPLHFMIYCSVEVTLLEHCVKLGWPISKIYIISKDFEKSGLDWEKLKRLLKGAKFDISVINEGEEANWDPLPAVEALVRTEHSFFFQRAVISGNLLFTALGLERWRNPANDQIKTLAIKFDTLFYPISVIGSVITLGVHFEDRADFYRYISKMYSSGEARFLAIENMVIFIRNEEIRKPVTDLMESISNQAHSLVNLSAYFYDEPIELPQKLQKQIEVNLSSKMSHWIQSGTEVVYDRLKVMMIGQGRAGKSSTIRSLLKQSFDPNLQSTLVAEADKDISISVQDVSSTWEQTNKDKHWVAQEMGEYLNKVQMHVKKSADVESTKYLVPVPVPQVKSPTTEKEIAIKPKLKTVLNSEAVVKKVRKQLDRSRNPLNQNLYQQQDNVRLTIWDFGGQHIFYALHHLYLTREGIYILVFDLNLMATQILEELSVVNFWLNSVELHAPGAVVTMVGTRYNEVDEEDLAEIDYQLNLLIESKKVRHLAAKERSFFAIDNSDEEHIEEQISPLRAIILAEMKPETEEEEEDNLNNWQKKVPLNWIYFMNHLINKFKDCITANQLFETGKQMNLDRERDIIPMLEFYENAGAIIPFMKASANQEPLISDYIVLSPEWLLKVLGSFVYDPELHKRKESLYKDGYMRSLIINYEKTGILSKSLLLFILEEANIQEKDYGFILQLCQEMLIMSRFDYEPEWSTREDDTFFLVPTMNKQVSTQEAIQGEAAVEDCISIYIHFARAIPIGLFERMICVMLTCNRDFDGTTLEPTITRNFAMFCFRETEVFLVDESENRDFRLSLSKDEGSDLNIIVNLLEIGSMIQEKLQSDVLGKHITSSIQIRSVDGNGNKFSCSAEDLITAVEKGKPKVRVVPAKGRPRLKKISQLKVFAEAAQMIVERKKQKEEQEKEQNKLQWEYHCFLAHTWGPNNETHDKVVKIAELLKERNLKPWLDEANLKYFVSNDIVDGLKKSSCILVFITELYFEKVENTDTNASREFAQAVSKGTEYMVPVVLDPKCLDPKSWAGSTVGYNFSDALYFDFSSEEKIKSNFGRLCERIEEMSKAERPRTLFD